MDLEPIKLIVLTVLLAPAVLLLGYGLVKRRWFAAWLGLFFSLGCWFTGPYANAIQRQAATWLILAGMAAVLWLSRRERWRWSLVVPGAVLLLLVLYLTSPSANLYFFENFVGKIFGFLLVSAFTFCLLKWVQPRVPPIRERQLAILLLIGVASLAMLISAFSWWMTAVEANVIGKNPVVRTEAELEAEYERAKSFPTDRGVFVLGTVVHWKGDAAVAQPADPHDASVADDVAYFDYREHGQRRKGILQSYFPSHYDVRLADGSLSRVAPIAGTIQTWNWKEHRRHHNRRALFHVDPIVVWGRPVSSVSANDGTAHYGIYETRIIAQGAFEEFQKGFLAPAVATARLFGWMGFFCMFLPAIPAWIAVRRYHRAMKKAGPSPPKPDHELQ